MLSAVTSMVPTRVQSLTWNFSGLQERLTYLDAWRYRTMPMRNRDDGDRND